MTVENPGVLVCGSGPSGRMLGLLLAWAACWRSTPTSSATSGNGQGGHVKDEGAITALAVVGPV